MSKFKRTKGKIDEPYLILVYGPNGVGKSSFAAEFPDCGFIDIEDGTKNLNVERMPKPETFSDLNAQIVEFYEDKKIKSIAIDTADHLETLISKQVCTDNGVQALTDIPHGKGFELLKDEWNKFFARLIHIKKEKNIILIAHADIVSFNDPTQPNPYDRYNIRLSKKGLQAVKSYVDAILFMNYTTSTAKKKGDQKAKGFGGEERALYTQYRAAHEGKNRFGLPYQIDLPTSGMYKAFHEAVRSGNPESADVIISEINGLMTKLTDESIRTKASEQFEAAKVALDLNKLVAIKNRLIEVVQE